MRPTLIVLVAVGALLAGCGEPTELSNADVAAKKAELNAGAKPNSAEAPEDADRAAERQR